MKQTLHIQAAIRAIELNLAEDFPIDAVARLSHVSPMQLYRDFYQLTGHSVKDYIRKRRLSEALARVKHSDRSLAEIAYASGYSSQQAFCRQVKASTGLTPLEYKASESHYYFPMFNNERKRQISLATETIPPTLRLVYTHDQLQGIENCAVASLFSLLPGYSGRLFGRNGNPPDSRIGYELYIQADDEPEEIRQKLAGSAFTEIASMPAMTAAFAKTGSKNREDEINAAWNDLYTDWLTTSMFVQADLPYFEEYLHKNGEVRKVVLYLPVRKRNDYPRIRVTSCGERSFLVSRKTGKDAENEASQAVMGFLMAQYPKLAGSANRFYVAKDGTACVCGIQLDGELALPPDSGLERMRIGPGAFAVLDGDCCGDSGLYEAILQNWTADNRMRRDDRTPIFAVYETGGSFAPENIRTKVYLRLQIG
ncbi:helix-turn-helix domain-containing protein [Gorillibacterium sp. sgz500922]|uniref:helix-turn-helix domain-containing protein n=1 Tax=Gorillibacterium sp. sgz500922 TaxID=3446694 RepID=UPI003F6735D3